MKNQNRQLNSNGLLLVSLVLIIKEGFLFGAS